MINEKQYNATLDHRLLTSNGRKHIKDDFNTASTTTKEISPIVIKKSEYLYDDVTLKVIKKANNIAPNLTNKYILDSKNSLKIIGGVEVANDIFNDSTPIPSTNPSGIILSGIKNIDEFLKNENKTNDIKNLFINNNLIRKKNE